MSDSTPSIVFAELAARRASLLARSVADLFAASPARFDRFHAVLGDLLYDFSKQRIDTETLRLLLTLAESADVAAKRDAMFRGELVNSTERRCIARCAIFPAPRSWLTASTSPLRSRPNATRCSPSPPTCAKDACAARLASR
jgi:hypothetical protein